MSDEPKRAQAAAGELVRCLGVCNRHFWSTNRRTNRVCPDCTKRLRDQPSPRVARVGVLQNGRPVGLSQDDG